MTQSLWHSPVKPNAEHSSDVLVVGAGIAGLSLAYWLSELAPKLSVTVVDALDVAAGASGRNAGFNTAGSTSYLAQLIEKNGAEAAGQYWHFKRESLRLMREHLFTRFSVDLQLAGSTTLYRDESTFAAHQALLKSIVSGPTRAVSTSELESSGLAGFCGGLALSEEGSLHPVKLLRALADELKDRGVKFVLGETIGWGEGSSAGVELRGERSRFKAQQVFLALNGYASQFHPALGAWVAPKRAQMVALKCSHQLVGNFYDPTHRVYFRQHGDLLLVGGMRLVDEARENTDADTITPVIQTALQDYAQKLWGEKMPVAARWSGVMGFTSEEKPYVRAVPFLERTTFVGGFSGHGMGAAFGVAREAVQRYLGEKTSFSELLP
jgi:glycine/D-amino acid oxidase-like deaminating enzyme